MSLELLEIKDSKISIEKLIPYLQSMMPEDREVTEFDVGQRITPSDAMTWGINKALSIERKVYQRFIDELKEELKK